VTLSRYDLWNFCGAATWPFWLLLLGWLAIKLDWPRFGRSLRLTGFLLFAGIATTPLSVWLMQPLEAAVPQREPLGAVQNIVMLAGAEQLALSIRSKRPEYSEAGERIITTVALQKQFPNATLVLVGGLKLVGGKADVSYARETALSLGVPDTKIMMIENTYSTAQNAEAVARHLGSADKMLLVTSAFHMPRAMLCFQKLGLNPFAYAVDSRVPGQLTIAQKFTPHLIGNFKRFDDAAHEWIGLIAYRWLGYTNAYLPEL
jgi:uncharacterized SAM-binding protein YcdF (DUF218 family)